VHRLDEMGVFVEDLAAAIAFFVELGLELHGGAGVEGAWSTAARGRARGRSSLVAMRLLALALLTLAACRPEAAPSRDVSDFCSVPPTSCGKTLVDEQGHAHVVVCTDAGR
jgi:hypothetical protein